MNAKDWLEEIEGARGEVMATKVLGALLAENPAIRRAVLNLITSNCDPALTQLSMDGFAVHVEDSRLGSPEGRGRMDILVETEQAILCIEAKFDAGFGQDQLQNYLHTLRSPVSERAKVLCVLAPSNRQPTAAAKFKSLSRADSHEHCAFVSWQALVKAIDEASAMQDTLAKLLCRFALPRCRFALEDIRSEMCEAALEPHGHRERQRIADCMAASDLIGHGQRSNGKEWVGRYFDAGLNQPASFGWWGYVQTSSFAGLAAELDTAWALVAALPESADQAPNSGCWRKLDGKYGVISWASPHDRVYVLDLARAVIAASGSDPYEYWPTVLSWLRPPQDGQPQA